VCGGYHTIVLCEDSNLYGFGKGTYGQCGYGVAEDTTLPKLIKFSRKCLIYEQDNYDLNKFDVTSNHNTTFVNPEESAVYRPPLIISDIKCGGEHTLILSSVGRVYTFGHGYTGQLGLGNSRNYDRPMIVKSLLNKKIVKIAAGWSHSLIMTSQGHVYVTGCGKYAELY
jgi:alpha-tubulin suppressor-like RCC1 family protein